MLARLTQVCPSLGELWALVNSALVDRSLESFGCPRPLSQGRQGAARFEQGIGGVVRPVGGADAAHQGIGARLEPGVQVSRLSQVRKGFLRLQCSQIQTQRIAQLDVRRAQDCQRLQVSRHFLRAALVAVHR